MCWCAGANRYRYDLTALILRHRASGYTVFGTLLRNADYIDMTMPSGAGALYSTTPVQHDYAYGLMVMTKGGHKVISHGGGIEGFNTRLSYYPDDKLVIVARGNLNGRAPEEIAARLARLVWGEGSK